MTSIDDLLDSYKPPRVTVRLLLDGEMYSELGRLAARLREAVQAETRGGMDVSDPSSPTAALRSEYSEFAARAEAAKTAFTFEALPREVVDDIRRRYPPSEARWERYRQEAKSNPYTAKVPEWDSTAAAPELISRTLTMIDEEPVPWDRSVAHKLGEPFVVEKVKRLWGTLSDGQATELFEDMWSIQADSTSAPLSPKGTAETNGTEPPSTTPPPTESPSQSS